MGQAPKDIRTPAEKARDAAGIIGSFMHEGYIPNPEDEAIHQRAERAKSRPKKPAQFSANAPLSESERRWRYCQTLPPRPIRWRRRQRRWR
jgi:hypothetical protein